MSRDARVVQFSALVQAESQAARALRALSATATKRGLETSVSVFDLSARGAVAMTVHLLRTDADIAFVRFNWVLGPLLFAVGARLKLRRKRLVLHVPTPVEAVGLEKAGVSRRKASLKSLIAPWSLRVAGIYATTIIQNGVAERPQDIWKEKTILLPNVGYDDCNIVLTRQTRSHRDDELTIVGATSWGHYHSYHRVISGLANYEHNAQNASRVRLILIGSVKSALSFEKALAESGTWSSTTIEFPGKIPSSQVEAYLAEADIGLGPLGYGKIGLKCGSPLRHRTLSKYGLPIISSVDDLAIGGGSASNIFVVPRSESPLNISKVISWHKSLNKLEVVRDSGRMLNACRPDVLWDQILAHAMR